MKSSMFSMLRVKHLMKGTWGCLQMWVHQDTVLSNSLEIELEQGKRVVGEDSVRWWEGGFD
jgi:hypothetical protein